MMHTFCSTVTTTLCLLLTLCPMWKWWCSYLFQGESHWLKLMVWMELPREGKNTTTTVIVLGHIKGWKACVRTCPTPGRGRRLKEMGHCCESKISPHVNGPLAKHLAHRRNAVFFTVREKNVTFWVRAVLSPYGGWWKRPLSPIVSFLARAKFFLIREVFDSIFCYTKG